MEIGFNPIVPLDVITLLEVSKSIVRSQLVHQNIKVSITDELPTVLKTKRLKHLLSILHNFRIVKSSRFVSRLGGSMMCVFMSTSRFYPDG